MADIFFPPNKDEALVRLLSKLPMHVSYLEIETDIKNKKITTTALTDYTNNNVRAAIYALKYNSNKHASELFAHMLRQCLKKTFANINNHMNEMSSSPIFIVPIPLHKVRLRERGYNQVESVLNIAILKEDNGFIYKDMLVRARNTISQTKLNKKERQNNMKDSFVLNDKYLKMIRDSHIILIDDVVTTGATLKAASNTLYATGVLSVRAIVLARSI
jgi:ComF family protein